MKKINLIEMLQGCSKRNGTTFRQSNPDGQTTVKRQSRLMSHRGYLKNLAMIFAVLMLSIANIGMAWGTSGIITAASTTDLGKGNTPRYVVEQAGVGRLMKNATGSSSWSVSDGKLTTGSSKFALQTYNAISSIVINGYGTGSGRTFSSMRVGTTTENYTAAAATGTGTMSSTESSQTITITPSSTIAANSYIEITLSGNIYIYSVELVYAGSSGKNIYLKPNGIWNPGSGERFAAYYWKSANTSDNGWVDFASYNACTPCFKATIPSGYDKVILCRMDGSKAANNWDNRWNQTLDQTVPTGNDTCFTISSINGCTDGKSCGSWGTYTAPTYTISFNGNGSTSGSTSSHTGIACNGSQTLRANGFSRTGWTFTGWNTSAYGDGDAYAAGATISSITSDITLYAQWEKVMYMKSSMSWWYDASAWFAVWVANADESKQAWVAMTKAENCSDPEVYKATVPGNGYTKVVFVRKNPANMTLATWDNKWNQSSKESMPTSNNQFTITGGSDDNCTGSWGTYSAPTLTISYNNGGGSGSMSSQTSIACGTDKATTANAFTRDGYSFTGWKADVDVKVGGSTKTAGTLLADGVTIQDISSNITLTAQWEEVVTLYTVTYNVNGGGSVTPTSATQASSGASVTLPTPTWSGYTFDGWYSAGAKIGNGGASYTPTADITLYAHWTDNISGKVFSFIDNNYGDKFKSFTSYGWVAKDSTGRNKTFTNASTGVEYRVSAAGWDKKNNAISALAKFFGGTSSMSIVIPTGKIATVKVSYGAYGNGDDYKLTINSADQAAVSSKLDNEHTNAQVISDMKEITLNSQTGTLTLGIHSSSKNLYIGRVSAVITGYTVSYAAGTYGSGSLASGTKTAGSSFTLSNSSSAFTRSGYVYDGWSINEDGRTKDYNLGDSYTTDAVITLYPHWVADCVAPTEVNISGTYHYFPGETISLTAAAEGGSGTPTTYQWYKGGTADGNIIEDATSATYTKENCTFADAGSYYCKVTRGGSCSTFSGNYDVKILHLYVNTGRNGTPYKDVDFVKIDAFTARATISLGANWDYGFNIADGCGHYYGNSGKMTEDNCTDWSMDVDGTDCLMRTTNGATYTFTVDYTTLTAPVVSITYPSANQAVDKVIYFDNSARNWSTLHYRIGRTNHTQATAMTQVPGTANLYKVTTAAYNNFSGWHIANNAGWTGDNNSIYRTNTNDDQYSITYATAHEGGAVTDAAITVTPTTSRGMGGDKDLNDNCEFYNYEITTGMKTQNVSITAPSNGTITVNYVDVSGAAQAFSSGNRDLAHTCNITVTAEPAAGYAEPATVSINGASHNNRDPYTITGTTVVAATFSPASYTVTLNTNSGTINAGNVTSYTYGTGATLPTNVTKSGFTFGGWYDNSDLTGSAVTTISTTATGNKEYWAKWTAAASLTALECNTLYKVEDMVASTITSITSTEQFAAGLSSNTKFEVLGTGTVNATGGPMAAKNDAATISGTSFTNSLYFKGAGNKSGEIPTSRGIKFIVPNAGKLDIYVKGPGSINIVKEGGSGTAIGSGDSNAKVTVDVTAGTYYLYATASSRTLFGIQLNCCTTPAAPTAFSAGSITSTEATFSITDEGDAASYDIYYSISSTAPAAGTAATTTSTSKTKAVTGLTANTTYYAWVRSVCDASHKSDWVALTGSSFETTSADPECTPTTLFSMVVSNSASNYTLAAGTTINQSDEAISSRLTSISGGGISITNNSGSSNKTVFANTALSLQNSDVQCAIALTGATLQAGDVITVTTTNSGKPYLTSTSERSNEVTWSTSSYTHSVTLANTSNATGKNLIGKSTFYLWYGGSAVYIRSVSVTRPCDESGETCQTPNITTATATIDMTTAETKSQTISLSNEGVLSTVTYAWTNADGTAIAAAANASGTNTSRLTLASPTSGTYNVKCTVTNDCGGGETKTATSPTFTFRVAESTGCPEIAKVIVSGTSTGTDSGTKIAETGGYGVKLESTTASHGGNTGYKIGSNNYVYLQLASGEQFQNGDKVKVYITKVSDQGDHKLHIFQGTTAAGTEVATVETPVLGWNEATLSNVTSGNRSLTIHRSSGTTEQNHYIYAFAVERCKDCSPATFEGMSYDETEYTVGASASAITVTNPENADSYQWYYNTANDRSDATKTVETGATSASFTPSTTAAFATRYYWCELTNDCGTVKTPTVGITVRASKSNPTVTWTNPSSVNYGGGGYTIRATVDQTEWDGTLTASMLTAPTGIAITNVTIGADAGKKYIEVTFDVQTSFDTETYGSTIPFVLSLPETTNYNEFVSEKDLTYSACAGGGDSDNSYVIGYSNADATNVSSSADFRAYNTASNWYSAGNTTFTDMTSTDGFSISATNKSGYYWKKDGSFTTSGSSDNRLITLKLAKNNGATIRWTNEALSFTKIRIIGRNTSSDESSTFTVSNGTTEKTFTFESGSSIIQTKEVVMDFVAGSKKGVVISGGTKELNVLIELVPASGGGTLTTTLAFASAGPLNKLTSDANFTNTASVTGANSNTLGTITYSSDHPEIASVNATTGEVTLVAAGTAVITATLSRSGCYKSATASYTINVEEVTCEEPAGVIAVTSGSTEVCSAPVGLTLTHIEGATVQWYNGDAEISNGGDYTITAPTETTSVLSTTTPGNYSAKAYKDCKKADAKRSNTIKVVSAASEVDVTPIIEKWYIKNGRPTPDIALWQLGEGTRLKSVAWSPTNTTGLTAAGDIYEQGGIVYLTGKEPSANKTGEDKSYTLTLTVYNSCGSETVMSAKTITIVHQKNTDKHVLAFVVGNTAKKNNKYVAIGKGFTESITASQTTNVPLYNAIANNFDVQATNIYSTDDEKKLKEYYSQYDILCITDYPNTGTKGENGKSYVDAIGSLIDIRPILTMEAYVSGLANWRSKGVVGTRTTPTRRQYNMLLQCKDHEIFSGTSPETLGEGDDIMYRVNMVDSTQSRYAELDAVGKSSHASDTAALQGFTTGEMDLLALGLIDNGSGTDLQVGAERQTNMKARLMVLGINSYAMERLSEDGETVVINALNYLMKKNAEDIEDCSNYFLGGASGDARNWHNVANWSGATLPDKTQEVRILAPCEIKNGQKAHVARVKIVPNGNYKSVPVTGGSLTINAGGALTVEGKVQAATAPNYYETRPTSAANLILNTNSEKQAALIFDNEEAETQATVNLYSLGRKEGGAYQFQYFAVPMEVVPVNPVFANEAHNGTGIYTYVWHENGGWERRGYYTDLLAFEGLGITTKSTGAMNYTMTGNLASTAEKEITLTKGADGDNIIGNSWMAPINIASLRTGLLDDANIVDKTVYIYCAGNDKADGDDAVDKNTTETAGQWLAIPIDASGWDGWEGLKVIPAMQAFLIHANAETTLTLNYKDHVRSTEAAQLNQKLRAPGRRMALQNEFMGMRMRVTDSQTHTDLYLFEGEQFSEAYDNGWEAKFVSGDGRSAQFYAMNRDEKMAVLATDELEGTPVGFTPGKESNYTISFFGDENGYYLNDIKLRNSVRISEGETYTFTYEEGDAANRFYISRIAINAPEVATGMENLDAAAPRVQKIIYNDKLYIIRGGRLYDATGKVVK